MGFNRVFLQDLKRVKERMNTDKESFVRLLSSADMISGPSDSMRYIDKIMRRHVDEGSIQPGAKGRAES